MKRTLPIKIIALCTLLCFSFTTVGWGQESAVSALPFDVATSISLDNGEALFLAKENFTKLLDVLPSHHAVIESYNFSDGEDLTILIQDPHCHYSAQHNESQILKLLMEEYGFEVIYVEGAAREINTSLFTAYPYQDVKEKVFHDALKRGEISGADYYAIMRTNALTPMHGVEDSELYQKNYDAALALIRRTDEMRDAIESLKTQLELEKNKVYSRTLKALDDILSEAHMRTDSSRDAEYYVELVAHLLFYVEKYNLNIRDYSEIEKLRTIVKKTKSDDGKSSFYESSTFNAHVLIREINDFSRYLKQMIFRSTKERVIDEAWSTLQLLEKASRLELTRAEWDDYKEIYTSYDTMIESLDSVGLREIVSGFDALKHLQTLVQNFYALVDARDESMLKNFNTHRQKNTKKRTILIAGGFHAERLERSLRDEDVSYISIKPRIDALSDARTIYLERLKAPASHSATLALQNAFERKENIETFFTRLFEAHCEALGDLAFDDFKKIIIEKLKELSGDSPFALQDLKALKLLELEKRDMLESEETDFDALTVLERNSTLHPDLKRIVSLYYSYYMQIAPERIPAFNEKIDSFLSSVRADSYNPELRADAIQICSALDEAHNRPMNDFLKQGTEQLRTITQGLVTISGGGGSHDTPEIDLYRLLFDDLANMPLVAVVPADDDGGGTAKILYESRKRRLILPAMGDTMNGYAGLSMRTGKSEEYLFSALNTLTRLRLDSNEAGTMSRSLLHETIKQLNLLATEKAPQGAYVRLMTFFSQVSILLDAVEKLDFVTTKGQSIGNMIWLGAAHEVIDITQKMNETRDEEIALTHDEILQIQLYIAQLFGIDDAIVLPSHNRPGTLYALLDETTVGEVGEAQTIEDQKVRFGNKEIGVKEELQNGVSETHGFVYGEYFLDEGEAISIYHVNKESPFDAHALFGVRLIRRGDTITAEHYRVGFPSEEIQKELGWTSSFILSEENIAIWHAKRKECGDLYKELPQSELTQKSEVIGVLEERFPNDQFLWGAKVQLSGPYTIQLTLDRTGGGTYIERASDGERVKIKGRVIVKQTNITESYHESRIVRAGFINGQEHTTEANTFILESLENTQIGCLIRPGSQVTSILPVLLIPSIRSALNALARKGRPVVWMINPLRDNETVDATIGLLIKLFEDSFNDDILYNSQTGKGFVTDIIVNNSEYFPDDLWPLTYVPFNADSKQRLAERPRGTLLFGDSEERNEIARRVHIHDDAFLLTTKKKDLRLSSEQKEQDEYGIIFDSEKVRQIIEPLFVQKNIKTLVGTPRFMATQKYFDNDRSALIQAIESQSDWQHVKVLNAIHESLSRKKQLTRELLTENPPKVIVLNLAHTILSTRFTRGDEKDPKKVFSKEMSRAISEYLKQGGRLVLLSGNPFSEIVKPYLFDGPYAIPVKLRDRIITISLSGAEAYRAEHPIFKTKKAVPESILEYVKKIYDVYGISFNNESCKLFRDEATQKIIFMSLRLPDDQLTRLTHEDVRAMNNLVKDNAALSKEELRDYLLPANNYGVMNEYDIRQSIEKHINAILEREGASVFAHIKGKASIDIFVEDGAAVLEDVLHEVELFERYYRHNFLVVLANESLVDVANSFPLAKSLAVPGIYPRSSFVEGSFLPEVLYAENNWQNIEERFIDLFLMGADILETERFYAALNHTYHGLVFDIDETLTNDFNGVVSDELIDFFIEKARAGIPIAFITARTGSILVDGVSRKILARTDDYRILSRFFIYSGYGAMGYRLSDIRDEAEYLDREALDSIELLTTELFSPDSSRKLTDFIRESILTTVTHFENYSFQNALDSVVMKLYYDQDMGYAFTPEILKEMRSALEDVASKIHTFCVQENIPAHVSLSRRSLDVRPLKARKKWAYKHFREVTELPHNSIAAFGDNGKTDDKEILIGVGSFCVAKYDDMSLFQLNVPKLIGKDRAEATREILFQLRLEPSRDPEFVDEVVMEPDNPEALFLESEETIPPFAEKNTRADKENIIEEEETVVPQQSLWFSAPSHTGSRAPHLQNSFFVREEYDRMRENFHGNELHLVAAGGGGDLKGVMLAAYEQLKDFEGQGKKITHLKLFTSNLKRGEENPIGGPTPMENIGYTENGVFHVIERARGTDFIYPLKNKKYSVRARVYDEEQLLRAAELFDTDRSYALSHPMEVNGQTIERYNTLAENDVIETLYGEDNFLKKRFPNLSIELFIIDAAQSGEELASDYKKYIKGKEHEIFNVCIDMGGDILARFPEPIRAYRATHPEYNVKSPNTDAVFLDMFATLERDFPDTTVLGIGALLGDGELGPVVYDYLRDFHEKGDLIALLDRVRFYRDEAEVIDDIENDLRSIDSEVSGNLLRWLRDAINKNKKSFLDKYPPDYVGTPEVKTLTGEDIFLRGESRVAWKIPHYVTMLYFKPNALKSRIVDPVLREKSLSWFAIDAYIRRSLHYLTEMDDPNNVYARLKVNLRMCVEYFSLRNDDGTYRVSDETLERLMTRDNLMARLAALIVQSTRNKADQAKSETHLIHAIYEHHAHAVSQKLNPLHLGLMIHALKTIGIENEDTKRTLFRLMLNPIDQPYTQYRGFDYWIIRNEIMQALDLQYVPLRMEAKALYDQYRDALIHMDQKERRAVINDLFLSLSRKDAPAIWLSLIVRFYNESILILNSTLSAEEYSLRSNADDDTLFNYAHAASLFVIISEMFRVLSNSPYTNGGVVPQDIVDLMKQKQFKESSKRIIDLCRSLEMHPKMLYKIAHVCFRDFATQLGYLFKEEPVLLMDENDIYASLINAVDAIEDIWPIPKVVSGMLLHDGSLISTSNDIGVDEHAEMRLIFKVFRHVLRVRQLTPEQREDIVARIARLENKARITKLNNSSRDIDELVSISKVLGDPFRKQTVYVILRPCKVCVEKLRRLGVTKVSYLTEHIREDFRSMSDDMRGEMRLVKFPSEMNIPKSTLLDTFQKLVVKDGFDDLQELIRFFYIHVYLNNPHAIPQFRKSLDSGLYDMNSEIDIFHLFTAVLKNVQPHVNFRMLLQDERFLELILRIKKKADDYAQLGKSDAMIFLKVLEETVTLSLTQRKEMTLFLDRSARAWSGSLSGVYPQITFDGGVLHFTIKSMHPEPTPAFLRFRNAIIGQVYQSFETYIEEHQLPVRLESLLNGFNVHLITLENMRTHAEFNQRDSELFMRKRVSDIFEERGGNEKSQIFVGIYKEELTEEGVDLIRVLSLKAQTIVIYFEKISRVDMSLLNVLLSIPNVVVRSREDALLDPRIEWAESFEEAVRDLPLSMRRIIAPERILSELATLIDAERLQFLFLVRTQEDRSIYSEAAFCAIAPFAFLDEAELQNEPMLKKVHSAHGIAAFYQLNFDRFKAVDLVSFLALEIGVKVAETLRTRLIQQAA
jgi:hydroxymethylpyrimidine pyrophosphatase-like HAD family hydrolase